jgi:hypothetical protein
MQTKRLLSFVGALLLSLALIGCNRSMPAQSAQDSSPADQNATTQPGQTSSGGAASNNASQTSVETPAGNSAANPSGQPAAANQALAVLTIPAGTPITVRMQESLSSASARPGERFDAVIDEPVIVDGQNVLPVGTPVSGHVTVARHSGRLHHPGELGLTLDTVTVGQQQVSLGTSNVVARGASHKKRNWAWIGGGTGGGALIGALAGGAKGGLIGAGVGAAAGTTTAFLAGKKNVEFGAERRLRFRLRHDVNVPA